MGAVDDVRKQLEHVAIVDWEKGGREVLEANGLFHEEYELAYKLMVRGHPPDDIEAWGSTTSDIFFLTVNLLRFAERDMKKYDEYAEYILNVLETSGDENGRDA